ncbi:MAG: hypothetical protein LBU04_03135 [Christensenellaceae bacterium]|nr:hypothetical protein [Christensenellaceae bacterium]
MLLRKMSLPTLIMVFIAVTLVTSFAWFFRNAQTQSTSTKVVASQGFTANLNASIVENSQYNGQTGTGGPEDADAPFEAVVNINIDCSTQSKMCYLKIGLDSVVITKYSQAETDKYQFSSNYPAEYFTFRLSAGDDEYYIDQEGYVINVSDNTRYIVNDGSNLFTMRIIYLDETRYSKWKLGNYDFNKFEFSSYHYMQSKFFFSLTYNIFPDGNDV